jgi:hypothetical protein
MVSFVSAPVHFRGLTETEMLVNIWIRSFDTCKKFLLLLVPTDMSSTYL